MPKPQFTTYTSIRAVAASGETLLAMSNAEGDLAAAVTGEVDGAPTTLLFISRAGGFRHDVMTAYLYDKATRQMAPVKWAGKEQESDSLIGKAEADPQSGLMIPEYDGQSGSTTQPYVYKDGRLAPMFKR